MALYDPVVSTASYDVVRAGYGCSSRWVTHLLVAGKRTTTAWTVVPSSRIEPALSSGRTDQRNREFSTYLGEEREMRCGSAVRCGDDSLHGESARQDEKVLSRESAQHDGEWLGRDIDSFSVNGIGGEARSERLIYDAGISVRTT